MFACYAVLKTVCASNLICIISPLTSSYFAILCENVSNLQFSQIMSPENYFKIGLTGIIFQINLSHWKWMIKASIGHYGKCSVLWSATLLYVNFVDRDQDLYFSGFQKKKKKSLIFDRWLFILNCFCFQLQLATMQVDIFLIKVYAKVQ